MKVTTDTIEFYNTEKIFFPKKCLVCAKATKNRVEKNFYHDFTSTKRIAKDYHFKLPICEDCHKKIKINKSTELIKILLPLIIGIIGSLLLYFSTFSWLISLSFFILLMVLGILYIRFRLLSRLELEDFIEFKFRPLKGEKLNNVVQISFQNKSLTKYLGKMNLERNPNLDVVLNLEEEVHEKQRKGPAHRLEMKEKKEPIQKASPKSGTNTWNLGEVKKSNFIPVPQEIKEEKDEKEIICPHCKTTLKEDYRFCLNCGKPVNDKKD